MAAMSYSVVSLAERADLIDQMNNSAVFGLIIVVIVLYFAMGLRNSIITALSIPLTLMLTFVFLKVFGMSNNNMVRFSLLLCIGLIVDNAIIVVENVYHHYQLGKDRIAAVIEGTSEIAMPVISATLTTMAAFLPMLLMTGVVGEYMGFLPKTVSIALCASLVVALVANPLILGRIMKRTRKEGKIVPPEDDLRQLKKLYVRAVSWALSHRFWVIVMIFVCLGGVFGLLAMKVVKVEMFPDADPALRRSWVVRFYRLWTRNQWKRERYAPAYHVDDRNLHLFQKARAMIPWRADRVRAATRD